MAAALSFIPTALVVKQALTAAFESPHRIRLQLTIRMAVPEIPFLNPLRTWIEKSTPKK